MTFTIPDHIVYAVHDLDVAIAWFGECTGVTPVPGGPHPGRGTRMALVALGERMYLELIGPDPKQPAPLRPRSFGIDGLRDPKLATWAVGSGDLEGRAAAARTAGYDPGDIGSWRRDRPDGVHLEWRMTVLRDPLPAAGLVPFLIDWGKTSHPAAIAPKGCRLVDFRGEHPQPGPVQETLRAIGVELPVIVGPAPALIAQLHTPNGRLELR